jgi:drug/metabolite transporter (DMT)-like permease
MSSSPAAHAPSRLTEIPLLLLLALLWGSSYTLIKVAVATIPPFTMGAVRTLLGGLVLAAIVLLRRVEWPKDSGLVKRLYLQGLLNGVIPFTLVGWAEQSVGAGLATILNSTTPIFTFLLTVSIFRHEPVTARQLAGVALGMAGVCLIVGLEALQGLGREFLAQLALLIAAVSYSVGVIAGRRLAPDPMMSAAGTMLCAATILVPLSLIVDQPWTLEPSTASAISVVALALFNTGLGYMVYFRLIHTLGSVGTTAQAYIRVPIGVALGVFFLGEMLSPTLGIGLICVVAGVAAMTMKRRSRKSAAEAATAAQLL